eukprot:3090673-Rhodomonas_salina.1
MRMRARITWSLPTAPPVPPRPVVLECGIVVLYSGTVAVVPRPVPHCPGALHSSCTMRTRARITWPLPTAPPQRCSVAPYAILEYHSGGSTMRTRARITWSLPTSP